jgi:hypothetical protein
MGYMTSSEALSLGSADAVHCKLAARLGCGDGGEEIKVRVKLEGKKNGERSSTSARLVISGPLILLVNTLSV